MTREISWPILDDRQYGNYWDFTEQPVCHALNCAQVTTGANAGDDTSATVIGVVPRASRLMGGYYSVSANSAGVDANNTSAIVIAVGGTTFLSKTNNTNYVLDTGVTLGTPAKTDMAVGAIVTIAITNGTTADMNSAVVTTTLSMADASAFPAPGLKLIATDGGTASISDGVKGILAISPGSSDNDEIYLCTSTETVKFAANKTFVGDIWCKYSESTTDDANVFFGFMNAIAAEAIVDDAGGPKATGDYVGFWKIDGGTQWYCGVQSNGTATPTTDALASPATTAASSDYVHLKIKWVALSSTEGQATFSVDGVVIADIHHTYASATEMQLAVGVKNGSAHAETLYIDALGYNQIR